MLPVRWMAPESLADGLFTPMSDIWSYGVLLYEMITFGSFPFQGLSNNQVMEHVKAGHTLSIPSGIKPQLETLLKVSFIMYEHSTKFHCIVVLVYSVLPTSLTGLLPI